MTVVLLSAIAYNQVTELFPSRFILLIHAEMRQHCQSSQIPSRPTLSLIPYGLH